MIFESSSLYIFSFVIYLIILMFLLLRKKLTFLQHIVFFFVYTNIILIIQYNFFPLMLEPSHNTYFKISYIPFLKNVFKFLDKSTIIYIILWLMNGFIFGCCVPYIYNRKKKFKFTIILSFTSLLFLNMLRYIAFYYGIYNGKILDTGIFILNIVGLFLGYLMYRVLASYFIPNEKKED